MPTIIIKKMINDFIEKKISWNEYYLLIRKLNDLLKKDEKVNNFDQILCLARGGLVVGDALNRLTDIPLAILFTSSYRITKERNDLVIGDQIAKQNNVLGKRILLVDDLVDSGKTMEGVCKFLLANESVEYIKTGVLWKKESSCFNPDYFVSVFNKNDWLIQPFEDF